MTDTATRPGLRATFLSNWHLILLLAVCIGRLWLMPLPSSFWLDEAATAMLVEHPDDPSFDIAPQLSATIYNWLPRAGRVVLGDSEIAYRIPSLLLSALALLLIGRLAARLIAPGAAWFAVFACLAMPDFNFFAIDARPYALGIFIAVASLWLMLRWLDSGRWRDAVLFGICAALLWRVHLAFWAFYPVFLVYGLYRLFGPNRRVGWLQAGVVTAAVTAALIPVALGALDLFHHAGTHVVVQSAGFRFLLTSLRWDVVVAAMALGLGAALLLRGKAAASPPPARTLFFAAVWWLTMPVLAFGVSRLSGTGMFLIRYISPALPGVALAAAAGAAFFIPPSLWKPASAVVAIAALAVAGRWDAVWPTHGRYEDWRTQARLADLAAVKPDTPVIVISEFAEGVRPNWTPDYKLPGFLYAQLYPYPVRGRLYPFPFSTGAEDEAYAAQLAREKLAAGDRFVIYGGGPNAKFWIEYFERLPELTGWHVSFKAVGNVLVAVFDRFGLTGVDDLL